MVASKMQQFQYNLKELFLRRLVFPMLFAPSDSFGGIARGGDSRGGGRFNEVSFFQQVG